MSRIRMKFIIINMHDCILCLSISHNNETKTTLALFSLIKLLLFFLLRQVGDIIMQVEPVDEQWILGVAGGKRGIAPKSYISLL